MSGRFAKKEKFDDLCEIFSRELDDFKLKLEKIKNAKEKENYKVDISSAIRRELTYFKLHPKFMNRTNDLIKESKEVMVSPFFESSSL